MYCTTCHGLVQVNNTGICLGCQMGFDRSIKTDHYKSEKEPEEEFKPIENNIADMVSRQKELENALQEPSTKEIHVQPKARASKRVRKGNTKRKKATGQIKGKESKVKDSKGEEVETL